MAARLAAAIEASPHARLAWKPDANEVFAIIGKAQSDALRKAGATFYEWTVPAELEVGSDEKLFRLVTSFATTSEDVERFAELIA